MMSDVIIEQKGAKHSENIQNTELLNQWKNSDLKYMQLTPIGKALNIPFR